VRTSAPLTDELTDVTSIPVREGVPIVIGTNPDGESVTVFGEDAALTCGPDGNSTIMVGTHVDHVNHGVGEAHVFALEHALEVAKTSLIHAAGLILDDGQGMILLHAPSGTGKSTTALALSMSGAKLAADDCTAVTFLPGDNQPKAWGLPRSAKVHERSFDMLPALREHMDLGDLVFQGGEAMVDKARMTAAGFAIRQQSLLPVAAVVNLRADHEATICSIKAQEPFDALHALMEDNLAVGKSGLDAVQELRLDVLSQLVGHTPCLEVQVAGPPLEIAARILDAVRRL
ncbi:MAG: hypothetical protein AAF940_05565, partial [Pseudomonadota bacterium]